MRAAAGLWNVAREGPRQRAIVAFSDCSGFVLQRLCSGIAHLGRRACDSVGLAFHLPPCPLHVLHPSASARAVSFTLPSRAMAALHCECPLRFRTGWTRPHFLGPRILVQQFIPTVPEFEMAAGESPSLRSVRQWNHRPAAQDPPDFWCLAVCFASSRACPL
jgi:hypothetical protein